MRTEEIGWDRRKVIGSVALLALASGRQRAQAFEFYSEGLAYVARITVKPGMESEYARIAERDISGAPGLRLFSVCRDAADPSRFWTIEFWDSQASCDAAMHLPIFQEIIASAAPLVETYERLAILTPSTFSLGGQ